MNEVLIVLAVIVAWVLLYQWGRRREGGPDEIRRHAWWTIVVGALLGFGLGLTLPYALGAFSKARSEEASR